MDPVPRAIRDPAANRNPINGNQLSCRLRISNTESIRNPIAIAKSIASRNYDAAACSIANLKVSHRAQHRRFAVEMPRLRRRFDYAQRDTLVRRVLFVGPVVF